MSVLQCGDRLVVSELSRLDRLLGQIIAILDTLAKGERRLRGAEGEHPRRGVRPGPSSDASPAFPVPTKPEPVEHCGVCRWTVECQAQWRAEDDLSLVANLTSAAP